MTSHTLVDATNRAPLRDYRDGVHDDAEAQDAEELVVALHDLAELLSKQAREVWKASIRIDEYDWQSDLERLWDDMSSHAHAARQQAADIIRQLDAHYQRDEAGRREI